MYLQSCVCVCVCWHGSDWPEMLKKHLQWRKGLHPRPRVKPHSVLSPAKTNLNILQKCRAHVPPQRRAPEHILDIWAANEHHEIMTHLFIFISELKLSLHLHSHSGGGDEGADFAFKSRINRHPVNRFIQLNTALLYYSGAASIRPIYRKTQYCST